MTKAEIKEKEKFLKEVGAKYAKELKDKATSYEVLFKTKLDSWFVDYVFQKPIICSKVTLFILDFYFPKYKVAIELDGAQHYTKEGKKKDRKRTRLIKKEGIHVIRIANSLVGIITEKHFKSIIAPYVPNR